MKPLVTILALIDRINSLVGRAVAWLTVLMVINVFLVVVLRYLFAIGWIWMQELYVWMHATVFLLGASYTLISDGHVRIDLFYRSATRSYKAMTNIIGSVFFGFPLLYLIFDRSWPMVIRSWENLEKSAEAGGMPAVFIFKSILPVFCILFAIQVFALVLRSILELSPHQENPQTKSANS